MINIERKYSKKREAILKVIQSTTSHPSANWIYEQLKPLIPGLSLGTVYRNINLFLEEGSVVSLGVVDGEERFDGTVTPHPHIICSRCGAVFDFPDGISSLHTPSLITSKGEADVGGFRIDYRKTVFYGICAHCVNGS
jgi:Fur family peroxide stress response transcriptional regulator